MKRQSDYASAIIRHIRECREGRIDGKSHPWMICLNDVENRVEQGDAATKAFGDRAGDVANERAEGINHIRKRMAEDAERHRREVAEEAAQAARKEAEQQAEAKRQREREEHEAALTREREAREKVEREAREAEEARIAEAARIEEARKLSEAAEAKRVANIQHRTRVRTGIEQAFMARGADDATAHKIAGDIIAGLIANLEVKF